MAPINLLVDWGCPGPQPASPLWAKKMDVITLIQSFGFPVAACSVMAWYVKYITDQNNSRLDSMNKEHREEVSRLSSVLENNTLAIQKLTDYIMYGDSNGSKDSTRE